MKKTGGGHSVDAIFVLSLFCVFAAAVLLALILGTKTHTAMKTASDRAYYSRTALSYISEKLRHCDSRDAVEIGEFAGSSALVLRETYDGTDYETTIYYYEGGVRELFCEKGVQFEPSAGEEIIEGQAIGFSISDSGLVGVEYTDPDGNTASAGVWLRSGGEAK